MGAETASPTQPFSEHLRELQRRLIYVALTLFGGGILGYFIHERLFHLVRRPLNAQLYYTSPTGGFNAVIKISILFGVIVTIPVGIYHLGKFLKPAFKHPMAAAKIIIYSLTLAVCGIAFAYFVSLPAALHFLANIDSQDLQSLLTVNEYLNFMFAYLAGFALLFQLPLIMMFINRIKPQRPGSLMKLQRYVILFSFIIAAILTPTPDPMNQTLMAAPIILLYQFSIALIWLSNRRTKAPEPELKIEPEVAVAAEANNPPEPAAPASRPMSKLAELAIKTAAEPTAARTPRLIMDIYPTT